jgi:glycosyltransferase involved in cell wall biosynthesis
MLLAERFIELGVPTLVYVRDAFFDTWGGKVRKHRLLRYVTTSRALAARFEARFGFRPVQIPPVILPKLYQVASTRKTVTFICPVPAKGLETAFALAESRPDIPFTFVESWPLDRTSQSNLRRRVEALENVVLRARTHDVREIYRETKILLMPSVWFEAWGRAVSEAQVSGIPALASNSGGLPEAVGPGGLLVSADASIDEWQHALSQMWDSTETYQRLAASAYEHARREEMHPDVLLQSLLDVIGEFGCAIASSPMLVRQQEKSAPPPETAGSAPRAGRSILLVTNHAFPPQRVGGSESSIHNLCLAMRGRGLDVSVFSAWSPTLPGGARYLAEAVLRQRRLICDEPSGYPVFRSTDPIRDVSAVARSGRPAVAVINAGKPMLLAERFVEHGVPTLVYVHDAFFDAWGGVARNHPLLRYVTTSRALAARFEARFGFRPVQIPPVILPELYEVESTRKTVTFICPVPGKGLETAFALAERRPDIPFMFVECWPLDRTSQSKLRHRVEALENVVLRARTHDMREIYRETKILLMPSVWFEAWGRAVSEAQVSGIPALASNSGGLPEAVGPGGLLVSPDASIDEWQRALSEMWDSTETYQRLSASAYQHARRKEMHPDVLLQSLLDVIGELGTTIASPPMLARQQDRDRSPPWSTAETGL